jgi:hypothetical protein
MNPMSSSNDNTHCHTTPADPRRPGRCALISTALLTVLAAVLLAAPAARAGETNKLTFAISIYGLAVGMSGDLGIGPINADLNVGFDDVLDNLEFAGMGSVRVGYGRWALTTDVIYMGLQGSKNNLTAEYDQWMVEPTLSYRVCDYFEALAGVRYNNLSGELRGPGAIIPSGVIRSGTQDWWDPIVGGNANFPLGGGFSLNVRGDVGGFGAGSDLAWQAFPYLGWQFSQWGSLEAGYRWLYMDYESGSGLSRFKYDVLNQGPQFGIKFRF